MTRLEGVLIRLEMIGAAIAKDNCLSHENLLELRKMLRQTYDRLIGEGVDLDGDNMLEVVDDLEAVRRALGDEQINLFSTSYGTQVAHLYCVRYPQAVKRSLMVGASSGARRFDSLWEPKVIAKMLGESNALWKAAPEASAKSAAILKTIRSVLGSLPKTWNEVRIDPGGLSGRSFWMLFPGILIEACRSDLRTLT